MEAITQSPMLLGEGPLWHEGGLTWVDIAAGHVWRHDESGLRKLANDAKLTSIVPGRDGAFYATTETSFCRWNPVSGAIENVGGFSLCDPRIRFNDGKADPYGNYWAGSMDRACQEDLGSLYLLTPGGEVKLMLAGIGISNHLAGELLQHVTGIPMVHVPYKGTGPATTDLLAGNLAFMFAGAGHMLPFARAGKFRIIGVTDTVRHKSFPDVPTMEEAGLKGFDLPNIYHAVLGPLKMQLSVVGKIN